MASHKALATSLLLTFNLLLFIVCSCAYTPASAPIARTCTSQSPPPTATLRSPASPSSPAPAPRAPRSPSPTPTPVAKAPTRPAPTPPPPPTPAPKAPTSPSPPPVPRPSPSPQGSCPIDILKLGVCANVLNSVNVTIGRPPTTPCCSVIEGLVDLEAAICLCTAIRANALGIINLDVQVALNLILKNCGRNGTSYQCN